MDPSRRVGGQQAREGRRLGESRGDWLIAAWVEVRDGENPPVDEAAHGPDLTGMRSTDWQGDCGG